MIKMENKSFTFEVPLLQEMYYVDTFNAIDTLKKFEFYIEIRDLYIISISAVTLFESVRIYCI